MKILKMGLSIVFLCSTAFTSSWAVENEDPYAAITPGFTVLNPGGPVINVGEGDTCAPTTAYTTRFASGNNSTQHVTGQHEVSGETKFKCQCLSTCDNTCDPQVQNSDCSDVGQPTAGSHLPGNFAVTITQGFANPGPTSCKSKFVCPINVGGSPIWTGTLESPHTCGACDPHTPIVLNLQGKALRFSGVDETVLFDIDGDGTLEELGWTEEHSKTVFLALDRNEDGAIDTGLELFGNHTAQPFSDLPNGYFALREFDDNLDGIISDEDDVFQDLLLWRDKNHNGITDPGELKNANMHLISIGLDFVESTRQDAAGNFLALFGTAVTKNHKEINTVDVSFFSVVPPLL